MTDPMKDMVRRYDAAVVGKGGSSIFSFKTAMVRQVVARTHAEPERHARRQIREPMAKRWYGAELERLRIAYEGVEKVEVIAEEFNTSPGRVSRLATIHGWKMRRQGPNRAKPGRLVGGLMGKLGGYIGDNENLP